MRAQTMSAANPWGEPWSNNTNAPYIPFWLYPYEKAAFSKVFIEAILYGIVVILFFYCMSALLNPIKSTKRNIKWALVAHTTAMFSLLTIPVAITLALQSDSYIDNREFPGDGLYVPGPAGYPWPNALLVVQNIGFPLNQWLADGLLLYRCHIIYSENYWATVFPLLMYIATVVTGSINIYEIFVQFSTIFPTKFGFNVYNSYYSICLALNVILMSMVVVRLAIHRRAMRKALGPSAATIGLYRTIVTVFIESFAIYAISLLLYIATHASQKVYLIPLAGIVGATQVIAPYLIILRVANRRAITSHEISSIPIGSIRFRSHGELSSSEETVPGGVPIGTVVTQLETLGGDSTCSR